MSSVKITHQFTYDDNLQRDSEDLWEDVNSDEDSDITQNIYGTSSLTNNSIQKPTSKEAVSVPTPRQQQKTDVSNSSSLSSTPHYSQFDSKSRPSITASDTTKPNIPILIFGGLVMLAAGVYLIVKYYHTATTNDEPTPNEPPTPTNTHEIPAQREESKLDISQGMNFTFGSCSISNDSMNYLFEETGDSIYNDTINVDEITESKDLLKSKFYVNDVIQVLKDFATDSRKPRPLTIGILLAVVEVDANGDLKVQHASWKSNSWIFKNNYNKIQKMY